MEEKPNYYAVIPANVRYDKDLKDKAKLLYGEIVALCDKRGYCWATNKYFAELYGISTTTISLLIKNLVDKGYIESEVIYKEGTKEILNRCLKIIKDPYLKKLKDPIKEKLKENNTSINNTSINNTPYNPPKVDEELFEVDMKLFKRFWECYPKKLSKGKVEKWFMKNKPNEDLVNQMIEKINILKKTKQWQKNNGQYIPYPSTWLNAKGWEDEIDEDSIEMTDDEMIAEIERQLREEGFYDN